MRGWFFSGLLFFVFTLSPNISGQEAIRWMHADFPPYYIVGGKQNGEGSFALIEQFLIDSLTNYDHEREVANIIRINMELERKENVCVVGYINTPERDEFMEFLIPAMLMHSNRLIVLESSAEQLYDFTNSDKTVDLIRLLESGNSVVGVARGRSYGLPVDQIINEFLDSDSIDRTRDIDQFILSLRMLDAERPGIDLALGYPLEVEYLSQQSKEALGPFEYYQISGNAPYVPITVACSQSDFGKKVIQQVNELVQDNRFDLFASYYE